MSSSVHRSTAPKPGAVRTPRAVPFLLLILVVTSAGPALAVPADPPQEIGDDPSAAYAFAAERGLFGQFVKDDGRIVGSFLDFRMDEENLSFHDIRYKGEALIDLFDPGNGLPPARLIGPTLVAENQTSALTVHDNRYGWISYRGVTSEVNLRFPAGSEVAATVDGVRARVGNHTVRLIYEEHDDSAVTMDGSAVRIEPETGHISFTITLAAGPLRTDLHIGGWFLIAHTPQGTVIDALHPERIDTYMLNVSTERILFHLPPIGPDGTDHAYRLETIGVFPTGARPRALVQGPQGEFFDRKPAEGLFVGNGTSRAFNATLDHDIDGNRILVRQGLDVNGTLLITYDPVVPRILHVDVRNLTADWQLRDEVPELVTQLDKPATGTLELTDGERILLTADTPGHTLRFPLIDLEPETEYSWVVTVTDRAGNTNHTTGSLTTPIDPLDLVPAVTIHTPGEGQNFAPGVPVWLNATIDDGAGRPVPVANIEVLLNERRLFSDEANDTRVSVRLGLLEDGPHRVVVRAIGYDPANVAEQEVRFTVAVGRGVPGPAPELLLVALLAGVAVLHATGRRHDG